VPFRESNSEYRILGSLEVVANEEFAQAHIRRLSELRLAALEELAAAELDLGRAVQALPLIESAIATDALRERSRELQMIALYRSGRHAEALRTYQQYRRCWRTSSVWPPRRLCAGLRSGSWSTTARSTRGRRPQPCGRG
jgi:DNA-binding SARP family transcriptional activator